MPLPNEKIDMDELGREIGVDLGEAFEALRDLYQQVDARNDANTKELDLPCHRGCDACCHESVFLTPLEFLAAWDYAQRHLEDDVRTRAVQRGLDLYNQNKELIEALNEEIPKGARDHFQIARQLRFSCPLLASDGACQIYPMRELYARMFGCSFNEEGGVYGCHLVGQHLAGKEVTLLKVVPTAKTLNQLPLTFKRQVYPYYFQLFYGPVEGEGDD